VSERRQLRPGVEHGRWWPLYQLQGAIAADINRVYTDAHVTGFKQSWVMELLTLHEYGPMTLTELADAVDRTHSAISQKVAAMRDAGFVVTTPGPDARSKRVELTEKTRGIMGLLAAEWRATEAAIAELEAEIPYPLTLVVSDLEHALRRESFYDRIRRRLAQDPDGTAHGIGDAVGGFGAVGAPVRGKGQARLDQLKAGEERPHLIEGAE